MVLPPNQPVLIFCNMKLSVTLLPAKQYISMRTKMCTGKYASKREKRSAFSSTFILHGRIPLHAINLLPPETDENGAVARERECEAKDCIPILLLMCLLQRTSSRQVSRKNLVCRIDADSRRTIISGREVLSSPRKKKENRPHGFKTQSD